MAEERGSTPTPKAKPAASAAEKELTQIQKILDENEKALGKREATLDRAMSVLNTSIASFDSVTNIWTIFLTVAGIIVGVLTAIITGFGIYWWNRFRMLKSDLEEELKKGKETLAEIDPVVKKIKGYEKDVEAARQNSGKNEEEPSAEVKAKLDELAKKIDFLESFGVELKPKDYLNKGISFFWDKDYEKALLAFEHAIKENDKFEDAWFWKGRTLSYLKRHEEGLAAYDQAITLNQKYYAAWNNKGWALNKLKLHDKALAATEQAITLNPKLTHAWSNKGMSLIGLGQYEKALTALEQAITLSPKSDAAWGNMGRSLAGLKKFDEAKEAYKKAPTYTDEPNYRAYSEACFYCLEGKREDALATLGKAITLDEKNKERALRDVEVFGPLFDDPEFKKLTS